MRGSAANRGYDTVSVDVRRSSAWPGLAWAWVHLFGASGFAIAQPLFDVLLRHAAFLVAHRATPGDIVALAVIAALLPPTIGFVAVLGFRVLGERAATASLAATLGVAVAATALAPLGATLEGGTRMGAAVAVALSAVVGVLFAFAYLKRAGLRSLVSWLGFAPVVFVGIFLLTDPVARLVRGTPDFSDISAQVKADVPIVVVVLDEFGIAALLDENNEIDRVRYPTFAMLAAEGTWYRNARAVHTSTIHAVPAIVTGRFPDASLLPRAADHPANLFTLLAGTYAMNVVESETMLFEDPSAAVDSDVLPVLVEDAWLVYLHVLLPEFWAQNLTSIRETWGRFSQTADWDRQLAVFGRKAVFEGFIDRRERFRAFTEAVGRCEARCFHFLHVLLPHRPWELMPSTRRFVPWKSPGIGKEEQWGDDPWLVDQARQQYLLQVQASDRLLGELVDTMQSQGIWDDALLVVLADHGTSFWVGESMRWMEDQTHPEDVIRVPMFIKFPHQRSAVVVDEPALTIDVLPTLVRALGIEEPWQTDGCAISTDADARACDGVRDRVFDRHDTPHQVPADLAARNESLERKLALFGSGDRSLSAFGAGSELVGTRVDARSDSRASQFRARFDRLAEPELAKDPGGVSLARITAYLRPVGGVRVAPTAEVLAAVSVDGVVRAVVPARKHAVGSRIVSAILPESSLDTGRHEVAIHTFEDGALRIAGRTQLKVP